MLPLLKSGSIGRFFLDYQNHDPQRCPIMFCTILIFAAAVYFSIEDGKQWDKFRAEHQCRLSTHVTGTPTATAKDGWTCDDGKTYFR